MKNPTIDDFPAHIQARIRAAWAVEDAKKAAHGGQDGAGRAFVVKGGPTPVQMEKPPSQGKIKRYTKMPKGPNKTEQAYNLRFLAGEGRYEAITLRLPGGSRYTPDWMSVCPLGFVHLHEVKGAYRHPSQGRALTAWREARAAFPCFRFHWAVWSGREWRFLYRENPAGSYAPACSASVPEWVAEEIKATWQAARDAGGEMQAFRIIERMVDRLGYGRMKNNPSLVPNAPLHLQGVATAEPCNGESGC